jgi:hypothetical protein
MATAHFNAMCSMTYAEMSLILLILKKTLIILNF